MTPDLESANPSNESRDSTPPGVSYTQADLDRLGRERPALLKSIWIELGFCFSLLGSMFIAEYLISGFIVLIPTIIRELHMPDGTEIWPSSVFALVTGAFLLPFGRIADMFGGYRVFIGGLAWFFLWSLIAGFSNNYIMLIVCRALQGFGPAAFLPSGIMLVGSIYRPGPRKNLIFGLYGAFAPIGFFAGILISGISEEFLSWPWFFWIGAIVLFIVLVAAVLTIPANTNSSQREDTKGAQMDWWGLFTIVPGLLLVVFAITDSAHAPNGWKTPYIPVTLVLGILFLCAAVYVEGWVADRPLLPFDMFDVKGMKPFTVALFFFYGIFGVYLFYATQYIANVLGKSALQISIYFIPMCVGGLVLSTVGGLILHLLPGSILLSLSGIGFIISVLLFAVMPTNPNYWAYIFPAMLGATLGIDVTYNVTNVYITTTMPKHRQGLAGAFVNSLLYLGISFFLGLADLVVANTEHLGSRKSYQVAFWFSTGCAIFGLVVLVCFVKLGKAESELTIEEKEQLAAELERSG